MNIRIAQSDDWQKFRTLRLVGMETDPQAFSGDLTEEKQREESEWRKRLESSDRFFYIAEEDTIFVSMAGAKKVSDTMWMIVGVHTLASSRGRGLARKLLEMVMTEVENRGADIVQLMVNVDQKDAVHIYKNLGFEILKTVENEKMTDGQLHNIYVMEKKLS